MAILDARRPRRRKKKKVRKVVVRPAPKPAPKPTPKPAPTPTPTPTPQPPATTPAQPTQPVGSAPYAATVRERLFLNRFGTGFTQTALAQLRATGSPEQWLADQLAPAAIVEPAKVATVEDWFAPLRRTPAEKWATQVNGTKGGWEYGHDLGNRTILRRIYSRHSVLETMTDFWSTNLHIPVGHDRAWVWRAEYDATIRENALGRFTDLLTACSLHPAMRLYLDNWRSVKDKPNENQGRELLELHTVGRAAGYTEAMVKSSAILLSGHTVDWGSTFAPRYDTRAHTTGPVQVLEFTHPNASTDGQAACTAYLSFLAHHPATARNLATKIARYFVSDDPSAGLVETLAQTYLAADTSITAVLKALAVHPEFLSSEGRKVRTPIADLVATARVLGVDVTGEPTGDNYARHANWTQGGPPLFSWPRPDGPPVTGGAWASSSRFFVSSGMHGNHAGGWWPKGATYRSTGASWWPAGTPSMRFDAFVDLLARTWLGRSADARLVRAAGQAIDAAGAVTAATVITPDHKAVRWMFNRLTLALLDTPDHMTT